MKIQLGYFDLTCDEFKSEYKYDIFNIQIVESCTYKGLLVYVPDDRINDSFWVEPSEIILD